MTVIRSAFSYISRASDSLPCVCSTTAMLLNVLPTSMCCSVPHSFTYAASAFLYAASASSSLPLSTIISASLNSASAAAF